MKKEISELDKLFEEVGTYRSSKDYKDLLRFISRFRKYAPYNAMLLHIQKPGSKYVASASDWASRFNRKPKPGARPLVILRPFGPVAFLYELNDTEGKKLPDDIEAPFKAKGIISNKEVEEIVESVYFDGVRIVYQNYGTERAGQVQVANTIGTYENNGIKHKFKLPFEMVVNSNLKNCEKMATIYHELGHIYCGHLYNPEISYLPQERYMLSDQIVEFEAESVCWMLCERHGIDNPSAAYLSGYLEENDKIPDISIETVLKAVGYIEHLITGLKKPRKELRMEEKNYGEQLKLF
ncbi:MAG: hypothetical protein K5770_12270 [Lachnospiraceae bacterium]|nr:hypothetical protein [Lachnospiraceae bacterium]